MRFFEKDKVDKFLHSIGQKKKKGIHKWVMSGMKAGKAV
jgi:hypothetical protein